MAPTTKNLSKTEKKRKVLNVAEKLKILDLLKNGEKIADVARKFGINESSVRTIRKNEDNIRASASHLGPHAKLVKIKRNCNVEKMEDMLMIWIQDLVRKKIPVVSRAIRDQALEFYQFLEEKNPQENKFVASKGWFEKFKNRFSLHNVKFTGTYLKISKYIDT